MNDSTKGNGTTKKKARKKREPVEYKDKADRFQKLAKKRVSKALKDIRLIGNLSGSGYEYTPEQVEKIRSSLYEAIDTAMSRFDKGKRQSEDFEL